MLASKFLFALGAIVATIPTTIASCDPGCVYCTYQSGGDFVVYWGVYVPNDSIDLTCGQGVLDNLNGNNCAPTNWQCYKDDDSDPNSGAWMYFTAVNGCREATLHSVLAAAGTGQGHDWYQDVVCGPEPS